MNSSNRLLLADYLSGIRTPSGRNYVKNSSAFKNVANVTGANSATVTRNTTTPLTSISDFALSMPNNATGTVTWDLKILDSAAKNQNCELRFDYTASSIGTNVVVQVLQGSTVAVQSSALPLAPSSQTVSLNAPCGDLSNPTTIVIANGSGNSGTSTMNVANVTYGRATNLTQAFQATDWTSYTPTFTGLGTVSAASGKYRRNGSSLQVRAEVTAGTTTATAVSISLPTGLTIDTTSLTTIASRNALGSAYRLETNNIYAAANEGPWVVFSDGSSTNTLFITNGTGGTGGTTTAFSKQNGNLVMSSGSGMAWNFEVPISGWTSTGAGVRVDTTPASWSGTQVGVGGGWATTSATFADLSVATTSNTVTQIAAQNMTCVAESTKLPAITCTLPKSGRYFIIASLSFGTNSSGYFIPRLVDGSGTIINGGQGGLGATFAPATLPGIYTAASSGTVTFKLQCQANGTNNCIIYQNASNPITWSIIELDAAFPSPILTGSVTSNTSGQERIERANVASDCTSSPCTIASQSGSWLSSITRTSTGIYVVNFTAGKFSAAPSCTITPINGAFRTAFTSAAATTSSLTFHTANSSFAATDSGFDIICMGPR